MHNLGVCRPAGGTWCHVAGLSTAAFDQKKSARHPTLPLSSYQPRYIPDVYNPYILLYPYESTLAGSFCSRPRPSETGHGPPRQLQGGPRADEILPAKGPVPTKAHDPLQIDHHIWHPPLASPIIARALDLCLLLQGFLGNPELDPSPAMSSCGCRGPGYASPLVRKASLIMGIQVPKTVSV